MDRAFQRLSATTGASGDQIKLIVSLLLGLPFTAAFNYIPRSRPKLRHSFNVFVALFVLLGLFKMYSGFVHLLASIFATYYLAQWYKSPRMPWVVLGLNLLHLTYNQSIRFLSGQSHETVEVTTPQMMLVMKLSTFAWNVHDGRRQEVHDPWQKSKKIAAYPSFLEFLGYCFYFPGLMVGPYLDYAGYVEVITGSLYDKPPVKSIAPSGQQFPPGRRRAVFTKFVHGILFLVALVLYSDTYKYEMVLEDSFLQKPLWKRILLMQAIGPITRAKYYAVWSLSESAHILSGWGFSPQGSASSPHILSCPLAWAAAANVDLLAVELPSNPKLLLDAWNIKTATWLRKCVYKRLNEGSTKTGGFSTIVTFMTSALWHGIAPGYYLTFFISGFITLGARLGRQLIRPLFLTNKMAKRIYDVFTTLTTLLLLNYFMASFHLLGARASLESWQRLGWYGHVLTAGGLLCLLIVRWVVTRDGVRKDRE